MPHLMNHPVVAEPVLEVRNLTKVYKQRRGNNVVAVDDIGFTVQKNEVVGLLGPNGAGIRAARGVMRFPLLG